VRLLQRLHQYPKLDTGASASAPRATPRTFGYAPTSARSELPRCYDPGEGAHFHRSTVRSENEFLGQFEALTDGNFVRLHIFGYLSMGEQIWEQTSANVDAFVQAVGTSHSLRGVATTLRRHKPDVRIIAVEPGESPGRSDGATSGCGRRPV